MMRTFRAIILIATTVLVVVGPIETIATVEQATVELLPKDLMNEARDGDAANKIIATPTQVIENQVSKTWKTIVKQMLDGPSTGMKQKRTVASPGGILYFIQLFLLFQKMVNTGLIPSASLVNQAPTSSLVPQNGSPLGTLASAYPNPVGSMDLANPASATSYLQPGGNGVPSVAHTISNPSGATGMLTPYAGGSPLSGGGSPVDVVGAGNGVPSVAHTIPDPSGATGMLTPYAGGSPLSGGGSPLPTDVVGGGSPLSAVPSAGMIPTGGTGSVPGLPGGNPAGNVMGGHGLL